MSCSTPDCENDFHCFRATPKMKREGREGQCIDCDVSMVDWDRIHQRNIGDIDYTFLAMRHEWIREWYWVREFDEKSLTFAKRHGRNGLEEKIPKRIKTCIGKAKPYRNGYTPWEGNPIYFAQHATASCCRRCCEYWHGIAQGNPLVKAEIEYLSELAKRYFELRLPELSLDGEYIPRKTRG